MADASEKLAYEVMDCVPLIMRAIRAEMRSHREAGLSVAQFRAMVYIHRNPAASLSQVADHLGLTLPSTSTLIEELVHRGLVARKEVKENRRQIQLDLTMPGKTMLSSAQVLTARHLAQILDKLNATEKEQALEILQKMHSIFE
jgi:DNA-binding MarR family transcriptional regulator